ncbi:TonB-dependent receptor [Marinobacter nauticus]|uniref:TonB-dependent receptor n=1 Tax=Marinobacter nauticus TaxID=2743 RepID=UPI003518DDC9
MKVKTTAFKRSRLAFAITAVCLGTTTSVVQAQDSSAPVSAEETVTVVGQAARLRTSLNQQRMSDNLQTIVTSDSINSLPDANVSESLQRLPGISIERDQGEGRFVRIRGLGPDLNSVSINGAQLPAPEGDRRAVALDVLPSGLVSSLVVTKAPTPDMDANGIGGNIDVKSISALDKDGPFGKAKIEMSHNELVDETSPAGALSGGTTLNLGADGARLGVAAAVSWEEREFGSDNVETGGAWDFDEDPAALEEIEQRDYLITRERLGAALNLDLELDPDNLLYLRTMYSRYSDDEQRVGNIFEFEDPLAEGVTGAAEVERELKAREEVQEILSASLGGEHRLREWLIEYSLSASEASEKEDDGLGGAVFVAEDPFEGVGFRGTRKPDVFGPAALYQPTTFSLDEVELADSEATDEEQNVRFDITRNVSFGNHPGLIKFGAKASQRTKETDEDVWVYDDFESAGITSERLGMENFAGGELDYNPGRVGSDLNADDIKALVSGLEKGDYFDEEESRINDYRIDEDITAGYLMGRVDLRGLRLLGGFRYEHTDLSAEGTKLEDGEFLDNRVSNDYGNLLGSLHARYEMGDRTQLRASLTQSLARPTFEQLSPAFVIDGDEAEFGNPDLDPLESDNFDIGIEHYMGPTSAISAYAFYKRIDNFIYSTDIAGTGEWANFSEAKTFDNGDTAEVRGFELAASHKFSSLPAPWNGLIVGANGTWTRSDATVTSFDDGAPVRRNVRLPGQSDTTGNLTLGYETDRASIRLAGNYKSDYLMEIPDVTDERYDLYEDDHFQLDLTASYYLMDNLMVQFDAVNLTDRPYYAYTGKGGEQYNAQYEEYGRTYRLSLTMTSF